MAATDDVDRFLERYDVALREFYRGNPRLVHVLWSHGEDVTLAPPFGPPTHGWNEVAASMARGSSQFSDGEIVGVDVIQKFSTTEFAYVVRIERAKAKVAGSEEVAPMALRVTMIFRREGGTWKVVHRHADAVVTRQPAQSIVDPTRA